MFYVCGSSSFQRMGSAGSCSWFPCRREEAGCVSASCLALEAVKVRLLLIQRGAADFLRRCSLLHGYCSYPPGTCSLLFLLLCILYMDPPALLIFLSTPTFFLFFYFTLSKLCLCAPTPTLPFLFYLFLFLLVAVSRDGWTAPPCVGRGTSQVQPVQSHVLTNEM